MSENHHNSIGDKPRPRSSQIAFPVLRHASPVCARPYCAQDPQGSLYCIRKRNLNSAGQIQPRPGHPECKALHRKTLGKPPSLSRCMNDTSSVNIICNRVFNEMLLLGGCEFDWFEHSGFPTEYIYLHVQRGVITRSDSNPVVTLVQASSCQAPHTTALARMDEAQTPPRRPLRYFALSLTGKLGMGCFA